MARTWDEIMNDIIMTSFEAYSQTVDIHGCVEPSCFFGKDLPSYGGINGVESYQAMVHGPGDVELWNYTKLWFMVPETTYVQTRMVHQLASLRMYAIPNFGMSDLIDFCE